MYYYYHYHFTFVESFLIPVPKEILSSMTESFTKTSFESPVILIKGPFVEHFFTLKFDISNLCDASPELNNIRDDSPLSPVHLISLIDRSLIEKSLYKKCRRAFEFELILRILTLFIEIEFSELNKLLVNLFVIFIKCK